MAASDYGGSVLGGTLLGFQWLLVLKGISAFLSMPKEGRKGRLVFILISLLILATSTIDVVLDIWEVFHVMRLGGSTGLEYITSNAGDKVWLENGWLVVGDAMLCITIAAGDTLMLWRCFVLWQHKKWVMILPALATIGAIVANPLWIAAVTIEDGGGIDYNKAIIAAASLSVGANIIVTCLILLRLGMASQAMSKAFPDRKRPIFYYHVAAIITESAAPLALFGVCFIISSALGNFDLNDPESFLQKAKWTIAAEIFSSLYYPFCALSPQLIIYRVASGRSWKGASDTNEEALTFSQPMQFAKSTDQAEAEASKEIV